MVHQSRPGATWAPRHGGCSCSAEVIVAAAPKSTDPLGAPKGGLKTSTLTRVLVMDSLLFSQLIVMHSVCFTQPLILCS